MHALTARVREFAGRVLRPAALHTDRTAVPAAFLDELRALGALNHLAPVEFGGAGLSRGDDRDLHEVLSAACLNTWLVWAQHASLVGRLVAAGAPASDLAERVLRGRILLGAGVSDVRRYPDRYIRAVRTDGAWHFDGTVSWVSGWGLNEALVVTAVEPPGTVVTALLPIGDGMRATPLDLAAVAGSRTARVVLDAVRVPDEHVLATQTHAAWAHADHAAGSDARPHLFGFASTVLDELETSADPLAQAVATAWAPRIARMRAEAYGLADEAVAAGGGPHRLTERLAVKIAVGDALTALTRALLVARAGRGLSLGDTAQMYARQALFLHVQAQSPMTREAQLTALASPVEQTPDLGGDGR
jgi:alkylation response protein AidB-like acyl-CoA dehydrogenase